MTESQAAQLARLLSEARAETLRMFDLVRDEKDLHQSPGFGFRPLIWHLAHMGVFEEYWLLQKMNGAPPLEERYMRVFDPIQTPREESKDLPSRGEMESYLARVRERINSSLEGARFDESNPMLRGAYVYRLVLEHERQHQETLAYLLHLLEPSKKARPRTPLKYDEAAAQPEQTVSKQLEHELSGEMVFVPAGECTVGAAWDAFAYDNELPAHAVHVPAFKIDRLPVTNADYARFVAEGGYERREFWTDEGWEWREKEDWACPLYWRRGEEGGWLVREMFDEAPMKTNHPVTGVSWFEAEAYARFARKRLPTEAEWEKAASWDNEASRKRRFAWGDEEPTVARCNFDRRFWGTTPAGSFPAGASPYGCLDMTGNVWEWTATPFEGFPGFEPFPYPEYSETWFDGDHRVLKGGSWATGASVLRTSFRNFFRRPFRIAFAGLRCASDA